MGSHDYQVPKDKKDAGLVVISETAQKRIINSKDTFSVLVWNVQKMTNYKIKNKEVILLLSYNIFYCVIESIINKK